MVPGAKVKLSIFTSVALATAAFGSVPAAVFVTAIHAIPEATTNATHAKFLYQFMIASPYFYQ
jgi:hypothetical protein